MRRIAVVLMLLAASPAEAATVRATVDDREAWKESPAERQVSWEVVDRRGAGDRLAIRRVSTGIEVRAAGRLHAGRACFNRRPHVVRCRTPRRPGAMTSVSGVSVDLGRGDDRIVLRGRIGRLWAVAGAAGDDVLDARLATGPVAMAGGAGADRLLGGSADDRLAGGAGSDRLDGGGGADFAAWDDARAVRADLGSGRALAGGATDRLVAIENLSGSPGPDQLRGDAGANAILGGPGRDDISGRDGDDDLDGDNDVEGGFYADAADVVNGGAGADRLGGSGGGDAFFGGAGDDVLDTSTAEFSPHRLPDRAECGDGHDVVAYPNPEDLVEPSCEVIDHLMGANHGGFPRMDVPPVVVTDGWRARTTFSCHIASVDSTCRAAIVLVETTGSRVLGSSEVEVAAGSEHTIDLQLTPEGLEEVRRQGSLLGRLTTTLSYPRGPDSTTGATLRLRAPG